MILIEVLDNANCRGCDQMAFNETDNIKRPIREIIIGTADGDMTCVAASVGADGSFGDAHGQKIMDSGEGPAYLIRGGEWGVRFKKKADADKPWDLQDDSQWGEPYKVYGMTEDIQF